MRSFEDSKKYFQQELWTDVQGLTKFDCDSKTLLNAKKETKKVQFVDYQQSSLNERQLDSADSIGKEMTHFKPIRLMPLSTIYISDKILKIPSIRHTITKGKTLSFQGPAKSKFKPENSLKSRRSAFCLVSDTSFTENQKLNTDKSKDSTGTKPYNRRNGQKSKDQIICNIMLNKTNCKKMLKEKDDLKLAKMLQKYDNIGQIENGNGFKNYSLNKDEEPSARTRRYYLRTRSKQINDTQDVVEPAKRIKMDTVVKETGSNKVVVNGRKTRNSNSINGNLVKIERFTRGRKKK